MLGGESLASPIGGVFLLLTIAFLIQISGDYVQ